jgi:hypothetical protein
MQEHLQAIADLVNNAGLSPEAQRTVTWCLGQMPELFRQFGETYQTRYMEEIFRLEQAVLGKLAPAPRVVQAVIARLGELHEATGLPPVKTKVRKVA